MQSFIPFKSFINLQEELNSRQKEKVRSWMPKGSVWHPTDVDPSPNAIELSKHIIPEGEHHITIPATPHTMNAVREHLESNGHSLHDYEKGIAKDRYGREINIGKALTKTKAPRELIDSYASDDRKSAVDMDNHEIIISRHPYHIAEGSTNKPWKSCATLTSTGNFCSYGGGAAARKLPDEIREGTHVAYLVPKQKEGENLSVQERIDQAKARTYLKPYESAQSGHKILVPEDKVYQKRQGEGKNQSFLTSLHNFTNKHFPIKSGEAYYKNPSVYDDDRSRNKPKYDLSKESVEKLLDVGNNNLATHLLRNHKLHPNMVSDLIDRFKHDPIKLRQIIAKQKLNDDHVQALLKTNDSGVISNLHQSPNLDPERKEKIMQHFIKTVDSDMDQAIKQNNKTPMAELNYRYHDSNYLTDQHLHKMIDFFNHIKNTSSSQWYKNEATDNLNNMSKHHNINTEHIEKLISNSPQSGYNDNQDQMNSESELFRRHKDKFTNNQLRRLRDKYSVNPQEQSASHPSRLAHEELESRKQQGFA